MIVVAIVGILAAIALPAYQDYIIRSKMSEGVAALAACKTSVSEYVSTHGTVMPANEDTAGCSTLATQYVASLTFDGVSAISVITKATGS
ncbi:MAG TPA: pilin, partial [Casimicrobiaceae bacterium]|nr:pilin [Casimicrobiaceae bacterium]